MLTQSTARVTTAKYIIPWNNSPNSYYQCSSIPSPLPVLYSSIVSIIFAHTSTFIRHQFLAPAFGRAFGPALGFICQHGRHPIGPGGGIVISHVAVARPRVAAHLVPALSAGYGLDRIGATNVFRGPPQNLSKKERRVRSGNQMCVCVAESIDINEHPTDKTVSMAYLSQVSVVGVTIIHFPLHPFVENLICRVQFAHAPTALVFREVLAFINARLVLYLYDVAIAEELIGPSFGFDGQLRRPLEGDVALAVSDVILLPANIVSR